MNSIRLLAFQVVCGLIVGEPGPNWHPGISAVDEQAETARFLRPSGSDWASETEIELRETKDGLVIGSVTGGEMSKLKLVARFDSENRLVEATVTIERGDEKQTARVTVTDGKASVTRHNGEDTELDCPRGVLVTSAPDWTDAFLMARRYDRALGGKQEFPGLWIHPSQQPLRPTFTISREGSDAVKNQGELVQLDRYNITLRGGSRYVGWADARGRLIRLIPESAPRGGIVRKGWEQAATLLNAPVR
jgi:hypothetical protein